MADTRIKRPDGELDDAAVLLVESDLCPHVHLVLSEELPTQKQVVHFFGHVDLVRAVADAHASEELGDPAHGGSHLLVGQLEGLREIGE